MRGIRGAICAEDNSRDSIYRATQSLLSELVERNHLQTHQIIAAFFTMTPDLDADFPAYAAREMGWDRVPMLGAQESLVPGAPERAIRVLVLAEGEGEPRVVYLGRAAAMRPDLAEPGDELWRAADPLPGRGQASGERELLVVGLGLIGGSVAAGARRSKLFERVLGYDRDGSAAELALQRGLVEDVAADLEVAAGRADMVVLATPVSAIVRLLGELGACLKPGTIVTDVGSTKRRIVESMANLPAGIAAVGGHPMTGGTASGAAAADPDLFRGTRWALVESARTDASAVREIEAFVDALGAQPVWFDAEEHDRIVSVTSHLAAAVAVGLVQTVAAAGRSGGDAELLIGPGFRSTSRLAAGDPRMTADMLSDNADFLGNAIGGFISSLQELAVNIAGDRAALREQLTRAREARASLMSGANE